MDEIHPKLKFEVKQMRFQNACYYIIQFIMNKKKKSLLVTCWIQVIWLKSCMLPELNISVIDGPTGQRFCTGNGEVSSIFSLE